MGTGRSEVKNWETGRHVGEIRGEIGEVKKKDTKININGVQLMPTGGSETKDWLHKNNRGIS